MRLTLLLIYCGAVLLFLAEFWSRIRGSRVWGYCAAALFLAFAIGYAFGMRWVLEWAFK